MRRNNKARYPFLKNLIFGNQPACQMKYLEYETLPELAEYVQLVWSLESESDEDVFSKEHILPGGEVEIVFHFADPFHTWQDGKRFMQPEGFAISMMRKCIEIASSGKTGFVSVRFYPWGAYHFFKEPVKNFLDDTISTVFIWPDEHAPLMRAIRAAPDTEQRVHLIQQFLVERLNENKRNEPEVDQAIRLIRESKGSLGIEELCARTGFTQKQLERKFTASVGTTPKVFSCITRFLDICHHMKDMEGKTLTQLALDCGFYDQAHFSKEFRKFSGFSPKEFFERNNVVFADL